MSEIQPIRIQEEDGTVSEIYIQHQDATSSITPRSAAPTDDVERYGLGQDTLVKMQDIHQQIQVYTRYALGAFKNLAIAEVEEVTLKFNLKISAEGGVPMIASGKTESDFSIEVKCKFPKDKQP
jgi:Trypsin-co-occurring domain 1